MKSQKIDILGEKYKLIRQTEHENPTLLECDGFCDSTIKECVVVIYTNKTAASKGNLIAQEQKVCRHEIIHAFLCESGLSENSEWALNEEMIDWFASQFPKLLKAFNQVNCI